MKETIIIVKINEIILLLNNMAHEDFQKMSSFSFQVLKISSQDTNEDVKLCVFLKEKWFLGRENCYPLVHPEHQDVSCQRPSPYLCKMK